MTKSSEEGIVFDKVFFEAILKKAKQEGYVNRYQQDSSFEWVTHGKIKTALKLLLLYDKIYYPDLYLTSREKSIAELYFDLIENPVLQELIEIPPLPMGAFESDPTVFDFIKDCSAIKELLISNQSRVKRCFDSHNLFQLEYSHEYYSHKFEAMLKILDIIADKKDTITSIYYGELVGHDDLKGRLKYGFNVKGSELNYLCSPFNNQMQNLIYSIIGTERELRHINNLLEFSVEYSLPILTDDVNVPKSSIKEIKSLEGVEDVKYNQIALGVFLNEELRPVLPVVNSITDVLRLRKDRRISDFRAKVHEWKIALKEEDMNLDKIKNEMIDANKKLKTLGNYERVSTWITFVSLPIDIALTLSGLPISLVTSLPSFGIACYSKFLKKDYDWYLFGIQ